MAVLWSQPTVSSTSVPTLNGHRIEQLDAATVVAHDHVARTFRGLQPATGQATTDAAGRATVEIDVAAIAAHQGAGRNR